LPISYEVKLPVFEGPLELLLHLIEREELDITTISLAQVTDQYLGYISQMEEREIAHLVDFLVVASKLLLIKSRLLLPTPPVVTEEDEEDVGDDLVRQLIEYKKFKQIASLLLERDKQDLHAYVRIGTPAMTGSNKTLDMSDVSLDALVRAVRQALEMIPPGEPVSQVIPPLTISIQDKISLIKTGLKQRGEISFEETIAGSRSHIEIIVTFLAMLELIKAGFLSARQDKLFGSITLRYRPEGQETAEETVEPGAVTEP
jgi:segregation and condensation protein A